MTTWRELRRLSNIKKNRLTESGINRIMRHAQEEGIVIISTSRSVVVPLTDEDKYDFSSWQSLFSDYVNFCQKKNLEICEERIPMNLDLKEMEEFITANWYNINKESEDKFLEERNRECDKELYSYLKSNKNPYNFTATYGGYKGENGEIGEYEPSFIIYNNVNKSKGDRFYNPGWNDLYERALSMCEEYKQDAIYVQAPGKNPIYVDKDGNKINTSEGPNFTFNADDAFFTTTKRKRSSVGKRDNDPSKRGVNPHTFTADISFEELSESISIRSKDPGSLFNKMMVKSTGEIWNLESF